MAELRGEEISQEPDTQINMRASAFIPEDYISDVSLRLAAYKEISSVADEAAAARSRATSSGTGTASCRSPWRTCSRS